MQVIYRLRDDSEEIARVRHASLHLPGFGLVPEPHLFGTPEWWAAIESGRLGQTEVCGTISRVYTTGMGNDWPEFEVTLPDGTTRSWTREGLDSAYVVGRRVCVRMVRQRRKPNPSFTNLGPYADVVLEVLVDIAE